MVTFGLIGFDVVILERKVRVIKKRSETNQTRKHLLIHIFHNKNMRYATSRHGRHLEPIAHYSCAHVMRHIGHQECGDGLLLLLLSAARSFRCFAAPHRNRSIHFRCGQSVLDAANLQTTQNVHRRRVTGKCLLYAWSIIVFCC